MAGKLRFIHDGFAEIGRKIKRRKLRSRLVALEKQRKEALSQLGKRAWEAKLDLTAYANLRDQLLQLEDRAGQLSFKTSELRNQTASLQSRRAAEIARFDQLSQPVRQKKTETDTALRAAQARLTQSERAMGTLQGRLKWLSDELARLEQASGGQSREPLLLEQKSVSDQLAAVGPAREAAGAEVSALTAESRRLAEELARTEAERKSTLAPIDAELTRLEQESRGAGREITNVGREQADRFAELGAALFGQKVQPPALEESTQAVAAIDMDRGENQAALDGSLALTGAMPRWTMLKFAAVPLLLLFLALGALLIVYSLSPESSESGPLQYITRRITGGHGGDLVDGAVSAEESRKDDLVRAFFRSPKEESTRGQAIEILQNDIATVGSTADRGYLPYLVKILRRGEPELRAAAGHSIGMIGPDQSELPVLLEALNDPVPGVREAALAPLQQLRGDPAVGLLIRRVELGARETRRRGPERFQADPAPNFGRLNVTVYQGSTFLFYASDLEIGRLAFVSDAPIQKVIDFYRSRSGRPALQTEEFTRLYFGGTPEDPTGARRLAAESQATFKRAMESGKQEAEIQAEMDRYAACMRDLPQFRYLDSELCGSPTFIAFDDADPEGNVKPIRYVAVFEDRALRKTGFELHLPAGK